MDPATTAQVSAALIEKGILGIIILVLAAVCVALWRRNNELTDKRIEDKDKQNERYLELLGKYLEDRKENMVMLKVIDTKIGNGGKA